MPRGRPKGFTLSDEHKLKLTNARRARKGLPPLDSLPARGEMFNGQPVENKTIAQVVEASQENSDKLLFTVGSWSVKTDGRQFIVSGSDSINKYFTDVGAMAKFFLSQELPSATKVSEFAEAFNLVAHEMKAKLDTALSGAIQR